jgi:hypothetical protein
MHVSNRWSRPPLQKQMFCLAVSAWTGGVQRIRGVVVGDDVLAFDFVSLSLPNHCMYVFVEIVILRRTLSYPRYPTLFFFNQSIKLCRIQSSVVAPTGEKHIRMMKNVDA